jgi:hypothetical protein
MGTSAATLPQQQQESVYEYKQYQNGFVSRSILHLGVNIDVDNGRLGLDSDDESSPGDTDDSELPWAVSHSCMYHSKRTSSTANRLVPFQLAGNLTTSLIIKVLSQHLPTTAFSPNDNSLPQIHILFAQPIRTIPALPPLLPLSHIHCSSTLPI